MGNDKFCLRWNDFESNISTAFRELRDDKDFFDVTLACDDDQLQAHKVILSACSPFFRTVLRRNPHAHPLLYLKGIKFNDMQAVLNFMYHGEVNVAQEELNSFLLVAEELRVKGLTQNQNESQQNNSQKSLENNKSSSSSSNVPTPTVTHVSSKPKARPVSTSVPFASSSSSSPEVQQVSLTTSVKAEPMTANTDDNTSLAPLYPDEEQYEEYPEDEHYGEGGHYGGQEHANKGPQSPDDLAQYIASDQTVKEYHCSICNVFKAKLPSKVRNHLEAIHFPGLFIYNCELCRKTFKGRNALNIHKSTIHPKKGKIVGLNPVM